MDHVIVEAGGTVYSRLLILFTYVCWKMSLIQLKEKASKLCTVYCIDSI